MRVRVVGSGRIYVHSFANWSGLFFTDLTYGPTLLLTRDDQITYDDNHKGCIVTGDPNSLGEKSCTHYQLEGDAFAIPTTDFKSEATTAILTERVPTTYATVKHTYTNQRGRLLERGGDVFLNRLPKYFIKFFPDHSSIKGWYKEAKYIFRRNPGFQDIYSVEFTCQYSLRGPKGKGYPFRYYQEVEFDFPNRRYRSGSSSWSPMDYLKRSSDVIPPYSASVVPKTFRQYVRTFDRLGKGFIPIPSAEVYGDLVRRCANDATVIQTNSIELLTELVDITATLKEIAGLATGGVSAANAASAFLTHKYGLRLTVHDLKTVADGLQKKIRLAGESYSRSRAREVIHQSSVIPGRGDRVVQFNYKIFHRTKSDDWRDGIRAWFDSGLFPSLTNAWDLVPLSFVVDWFVQTEKYLNAIDANTYWSLYSIMGTTYSEKRIYHDVGWLYSNTNWSLTGQVNAISYNRMLGTSVHQPTFFESTPHEFKNYAELTALIVANWKR